MFLCSSAGELRAGFPRRLVSTREVRKLLQAAVGVQEKKKTKNIPAVTFSNLQFSKEKGRR